MNVSRQTLMIGMACLVVAVLFGVLTLQLFKTEAVDGGVVFDAAHTEKQRFEINDGDSYKTIGMRLENEGLIADDKLFVRYIEANSLQHRLRIGAFDLSPSMPLEQITNIITSGRGALRSFHIYDGASLEQIAEVFVNKGVMSEDVFWQEVGQGDYSAFTFIDPPDQSRTRLEGYLYPGTYEYRENMNEHDIITMMLKRFEDNYNNLEFGNSGLNDKEIVILASLIEKEAANNAEKPTIASVYMNRLAVDQPLQCDATVVYAMDVKKETLTFQDYKFESPYNTYLHKGLPPTPIASPGRPSLEAAAKPAQTEYYYYLLNTDSLDRHEFAKTYDEHLDNRKRFGYD